MKRLYTLILIATTFLTLSCRKEEVKPKHDVSFEIEFLDENPSQKLDGNMYSIWFHGITIKDREWEDEMSGPSGSRFFDYSKWSYNTSIEEGVPVLFRCNPMSGWHWVMRIYIDGEIVSWKECRGFNQIIDEGGWDNNELEPELGFGGYDENGDPIYPLNGDYYTQEDYAVITLVVE